MICKEIIAGIEKDYPPEYALEWDNIGLLAGRSDKEVKKVYIALDVTDEVVEEAAETGADLLITHHPLIFSSLKKVNDEHFISNRIVKLLQHDISYYAMHTNYDVLRMGDLAGEIMGLENAEILEVTWTREGLEKGIGCVADLEQSITLEACCKLVKKDFSLEAVRAFGNLDEPVRRIAISPGSGKNMTEQAIRKKADVLITGDIDHHEGIDAVSRGIQIIDAGHYGIEYIFIDDIRMYIERKYPELDVAASAVQNPFRVI